jgi:hypothetical protein
MSGVRRKKNKEAEKDIINHPELSRTQRDAAMTSF